MNSRGMTLLEVLLAMAIAVVLALGIYEALVIHYAQAEGGREKVGRAQMIRGVVGQIQKDVRNVFTGWRPVSTDAAQQSDGSDEPTSDDEDNLEGSSTASTSSSSSSSSSGSGQISEYEVPQGGVLGFADAVTLITRRTPAGLDFRPSVAAEDNRPPVSDLRLIRYWFGSPGTGGADNDKTGLVRQEIDYIPDVTAGDDPMSGARTQIIAEEIRSIALRYFDGYGWLTEWSQSREKTPQAIEIVLGMAKPSTNTLPTAAGSVPPEELEYIRIVAGSQDLPPPSEEDAAASSSTGSSSSSSSSTPSPPTTPSSGGSR